VAARDLPKSVFMNVSPDDAAAIYARACRAWYGGRAPRIVNVNKRIEELRRAGDLEGVEAWRLVAEKLSLLQRRGPGVGP
jgi:hypothetical protein